jgi:hypothetical protein
LERLEMRGLAAKPRDRDATDAAVAEALAGLVDTARRGEDLGPLVDEIVGASATTDRSRDYAAVMAAVECAIWRANDGKAT